MNPRRIVWLYEWYKAKTFCCAFFAAAMLTMVAAATIVRFPPVNCFGMRFFFTDEISHVVPETGIAKKIDKLIREVSKPYDYGYDYVLGLVRGSDVINCWVDITRARLLVIVSLNVSVQNLRLGRLLCVRHIRLVNSRKCCLNLDRIWINWCNNSVAFHSKKFKE